MCNHCWHHGIEWLPKGHGKFIPRITQENKDNPVMMEARYFKACCWCGEETHENV